MAPPAIPPSLPPSVEEAYRRKCVQLKNRTSEVEEANDAARLRLARIKRQVEKLRLERAFLLEQLTKRTSTNVEDSDGSPSPPPTDARQTILSSELEANPRKPKDRPLRTKRGHRKQSLMGEGESKPPAPASLTTNQPPSPASEMYPRPPESQTKSARSGSVSKSSKNPVDGFDLYCQETRPAFEARNKEGEELDVEEALEKGWKELAVAEKEEYQVKSQGAQSQQKDDKSGGAKRGSQDEDVEMGNYDTEDQETQAEEKAGE